jgi:hypothetical protein
MTKNMFEVPLRVSSPWYVVGRRAYFNTFATLVEQAIGRAQRSMMSVVLLALKRELAKHDAGRR